MGGGSDSAATIKLIDQAVIHRICSGQVILDLSSAVKELVENSLDAGATTVEVCLKDYGAEYFKVIDNGCGILPSNFQALALKHHTSKILDFSDLHALTTFGFRGEALSSLCALGKLTIETRTKNELVGTHLEFDHSGALTSERKTARQVGTTVTVKKLFSTLPVRSKEFNRNIQQEYGKLLSVLNAYALISKGVRLLCTNTTGKSSKSLVLKTQGSCSMKDNVVTVFGFNTFQSLGPLSLNVSEDCTVEGFLSKPGYGSGRNLGDRQFFYVNGRPVDMPKVGKLINELYRSSNAKQYPIAILNFCIPMTFYDINVTPDKRKIFFSSEGSVMNSLREAVGKIYSPNQCSYSINSVKDIKVEEEDAVKDESSEDEGVLVAFKLSSPEIKIKLPSIGDHVPPKRQKMSYSETKGMMRVGRADASSAMDFAPEIVKSAHEFSEPNDFRNLKEKVDGKSTSSRKLNREMSLQPKFVQSSLMGFADVNKWKHERCSNVLSELPVLRTGICSSKIRQTSSAMLASCKDAHTSDIPYDELPQENGGETKQCCVPSTKSKTDEISLSVSGEFDSYDRGLIMTGAHTSSISDSDSPAEDPDIGPKNHSNTGSMPNMLGDSSTLKPYPIMQFNADELRRRRQHRLSMLCANKLPYRRESNGRYYSAAKLESSQPEDDEGKAHALAAATTELERFFRKEDFGCMQVIGQFNAGFIIGKLDQDLFIVDQHAADEKYNFESLSRSTVFNVQPLLQPMRLELSPEEEVVASMHRDIIRRNGFVLEEDMEAPPGHHFLLKAVPFSKNITFDAEDLKELISSLVDGHGDCSIISSYKMETTDSICPSRVRAVLASRACRMSTMIGQFLTKAQMQKILYNLAGLRSPWNCPHGRPTMRHLAELTTYTREDYFCQEERVDNALGL